NPLTPIQLAVQQLEDRAPATTDPEYRALLAECTEIVTEEIEALRKLTREFSEFAKLPEPKLAPGDISALLEDLGRLYGERISVKATPRPLPAHFDADELRRALVNLVDNGLSACTAAGRTATVTVRGSGESAGVRIEVQDGGAGIEAGALSRIFAPGF